MSEQLLEPLLHWIGILAPILASVFGIIAMSALLHHNYSKFISFIIKGAICIGAAVAAYLLTPKKTNTSKPVESTPSPTATSTLSPYADHSSDPISSGAGSSNTTTHLPWELIGFVGTIAIIIAAIVIGLVFIVPQIVKKRNAKSENIGAWKDLIKRHNEVRAQWAAYEMDMSKLIDMPVMTDMREPVIIALHKALKTASSLAPKSLDKLAYTPIKESAFLVAVNELEVTFNTAEQTAKKIAWSKFTKEERRSLSTAKQLLTLAMDAGASPAERQVAYKRVFKELQGLIEFPEKARLELEARHQLSLAA